MLRRRQIAASPLRGASETWTVVTQLVADTIATSSALARDEAEAAMQAAASAGRMLIAGGHLDRHPLTLIAGAAHCEITTTYGKPALTHEENLNPIPGAAKAENFTIYLPSPPPLQAVISEVVADHHNLSDAAPPAELSRSASAGALIDTDALRKVVTRR
ncbi:hypothetical protein [Haloechinothrix salitolerans]|uniref:MmgE/PrpD family protein n=1 Tax=Haloechinothrix salitolerans TaxID=926830 RepID=A0ABW2C8Q1_9PSEU